MALAIPLDSLFQRNPVSAWDDVQPMFGDVICSLGLWCNSDASVCYARVFD
jgi:hypothetical protein